VRYFTLIASRYVNWCDLVAAGLRMLAVPGWAHPSRNGSMMQLSLRSVSFTITEFIRNDSTNEQTAFCPHDQDTF